MSVSLVRRELPPDNPLRLIAAQGGLTDLALWELSDKGRQFSIIRSRDLISTPRQEPDWRWHISVAGTDGNVPPWELLVEIAHQLRPGVPFAVGVPPRSWWINVHPGALHLYQTKDENLVAQWQAEGQGHTPT